MRRLLTTVLLALGLLSVLAPAATAQDEPDAGQVTVIEVSGLLDDVIAGFIEDSIVTAEQDGDLVLVLQVNSTQAVISDDELILLAEQIETSAVPVVVWVGPSGARATGKVAQLASVAADLGVSPGSRLGDTGELLIEPTLWDDEAAAFMVDQSLNWEQVIELGVVECERVEVDELGRALTEEQQLLRCAAPTVGDFVVDLDERGFESREVVTADEIRLEPLTRVRFQGLDLVSQMMHTVASPPVTYLLLVIGIALLLFELYSVGIGIAGLVGAISVGLAGYGLGVLPFRWWALVLMLVSFVVYAADAQTAIPGPRTVVATVLFAIGTLALWDGVPMSWIPMTVGIIGIFVVMWFGMPLMMRGRFGTPRIDRKSFVGDQGSVVEPGLVELRDARWRAARADDAELEVGARVRVVDIDGLDFVVEPMREMRP